MWYVLGVLLQILPTSDFLGWQRGETWEMEEVPGYGVYVAGRAMGSLASINDLLVLLQISMRTRIQLSAQREEDTNWMSQTLP